MTRARLAAVLAFAVAAAMHPSASARDGDGIVRRFLAYPTGPHSYRAHRRIEATGAGLRAAIDADTDYSPAGGFHYEVVSQEGSGIIRSHVLVPLLEEEQQLIARGATATVAISPANYQFADSGDGDGGLAKIALQPLRKERALIDGELLVKPDDGELVRLDGRLAKNPSFWTKRVDVVRLYQRINGVVMPVSLDSTAQLRLFGRSTLHMTYHYTAIDDLPVAGNTTN